MKTTMNDDDDGDDNTPSLSPIMRIDVHAPNKRVQVWECLRSAY